MGLFAKEVRILLLMVLLGAASVIALVRYTDICRLHAVTINGEEVNRVELLGLHPDRPIIQQPLDSLADALMTKQGIVQVDIDYKLPNTLRITTNSLEPKCYLLDVVTGAIYGIDETGRVVPVEYQNIDWEAPLFTGVRVKHIHDYPNDGRVSVILSQLKRVRQNNEQLYRQIEEIDLSCAEYALVRMANKQYGLKIRPEEFSDRIGQFDQFMTRYRPETDSITSFDLTYADMIIRQGYVEPKEKPVVDTSEVNDKASLFDESELVDDEDQSARQAQAGLPAAPQAQPMVTSVTAPKTAGAGAKASKAASTKPGSARTTAGKTTKTPLKAKAGLKVGKLATHKNGKIKQAATKQSPKVATKKTPKKMLKTTKNG